MMGIVRVIAMGIARVPAIWFFVILILGFSMGKISDLLNVPRSKLAAAKVIAMEHNFSSGLVKGRGGATHRRGFGSASLTNVYHITIELDGGGSQTFSATRKAYESLSIGSAGVLAHHGGRIRKFHVGKTLEEIAG